MHERLPIGAITAAEEGCITVDHKRCIGCSACTTACPWMMATVNTESKNPRNVCYAVNAQTPANRGVKIIEWKDITV